MTIVSSTQAQHTESRPSLYYPAARESGEMQGVIGLRLLTLPQDIVEEEINKAPSLDVSGAMTLGLGFDLTGGATVQYVTNQLRLGTRWSHRLGAIGVGAGYDVALWFGFVDFEGFDNRANGWMHYPNVFAGIDFGDVRLTVRSELIWIQAMRSFAGDNEVRNTSNRIAGSAWTIVLEQPFAGGTHLLLGVRLSHSDFHYQSWFAFSTFERKLVFSELLLGILL